MYSIRVIGTEEIKLLLCTVTGAVSMETKQIHVNKT